MGMWSSFIRSISRRRFSLFDKKKTDKEIKTFLQNFLQNIENNLDILIKTKLKDADEDAKDLLKKMLKFKPEDRITMDEIKKHPFYLRGENKYKEMSKK